MEKEEIALRLTELEINNTSTIIGVKTAITETYNYYLNMLTKQSTN